MKLIHSKREKPNKHRSKEPMLDSFHDTTLRTRLEVGSAQSVGRVQRHCPEECGQVEVPGVIEPHGGGQEGLERDGPGGGLLEGQALRFLVGRGVE